MTAVEAWNAENPEWDWGWWDALGADGRRKWLAKARKEGRKTPPPACDRFRDQRNPPDDGRRFRRAKDGMKSVALLVPPQRVDGVTLRVPGIGVPIRVKCPEGLPPQGRMKAVRLVPRGDCRDMRHPERLRFEAHVSVEVDVDEPKARFGGVVGLDRGIADTCALGTGERWSPPEPTAKEARRLAKTEEAVRDLARRKRQGARAWDEALRARRKIRGRVRGRALEAMRQHARSLAERYRTVVVEDLRLPAICEEEAGYLVALLNAACLRTAFAQSRESGRDFSLHPWRKVPIPRYSASVAAHRRLAELCSRAEETARQVIGETLEGRPGASQEAVSRAVRAALAESETGQAIETSARAVLPDQSTGT